MKTLALLGLLALATVNLARAEDPKAPAAKPDCTCCKMDHAKGAMAKKAAHKEKRAAKHAMTKAIPSTKTTTPSTTAKTAPAATPAP